MFFHSLYHLLPYQVIIAGIIISPITNATNNLSQRYSPNLFLNSTDLKNKQIYPYQLSFNNTGVTNFHSTNLSFIINLSSFKGREYIIPDPFKYEPGIKDVGHIANNKTGEIIRNVKIKQRTPLIFKAKNAPYKNTELSNSVNIYNNKLLRNYGYQSQENTLDYSYTGINKKEDSISFWDDTIDQITWKNTDTYPISVLNVYPESSRLEDLLITNKTGIKLKSDIYGNEFYFIKPVYPKRIAGAAYIPEVTEEEDTSTSITCTTAADYYDGLFFNTTLSALCAAAYEADGTLYSSITGMYDQFIINDSTLCSLGSLVGEGISFFAPLSTWSCSDIHTHALSCGSISAVSAVDGGPFIGHPSKSSHLTVNRFNFNNTTIPYYTIDTSVIYTNTTTTYESANLNNFATNDIHLFEQQYISAGEIYVRNVSTQLIEPLSTAFVNVFNKHNTGDTKSNILSTSNILDFDIIENTIYIQTSAETVTELYTFEDDVFKVGASSKSIITQDEE